MLAVQEEKTLCQYMLLTWPSREMEASQADWLLPQTLRHRQEIGYALSLLRLVMLPDTKSSIPAHQCEREEAAPSHGGGA